MMKKNALDEAKWSMKKTITKNKKKESDHSFTLSKKK